MLCTCLDICPIKSSCTGPVIDKFNDLEGVGKGGGGKPVINCRMLDFLFRAAKLSLEKNGVRERRGKGNPWILTLY